VSGLLVWDLGTIVALYARNRTMITLQNVYEFTLTFQPGVMGVVVHDIIMSYQCPTLCLQGCTMTVAIHDICPTSVPLCVYRVVL